MSVDPVGLTSAAVTALIDAELSALANDAQALQAQLQPGDVVSATVLPSNGLTDLVQINGNRVAAALPPTLHPGDVIQVQVTAFDGDQILLQMLEAETPPPPAAPSGTPTGTPTGTPATPGAAAPASPAAAPAAGAPAPGALASAALVAGQGSIPPTAIFVAVAVRAGESLPAPAPAPLGGAPTNVILPPPAKPSAVPFPLVTGSEPSSIEARLAAARTGLPPPTPPAGTVAMRAVAAPVTPTNAPPPSAARPFFAPPPIAAAARAVPATSPPPITPSASPATSTTPATSGAPAPPTLPAAAVGLAAYRDPVTLVRALNLPVTPTTVAAAKLALDNPQRLPNALATLESALPNTDDPRIATLRAVSAFVGRIDPSSSELASQIASYVEHVVDGYEPKLATALAAQSFAEPLPAGAPAQAPSANTPAPPEAAAAAAAGENAAATPALPGTAAAPPEPALPVVFMADAAVRAAALVHDLKSALFSILATPPTNGSEELTATAASALTALTGAQLSAANALAANPQTITFSIPLWTGGTYQQAQVQVDRDAPDQRGSALDGDNFHIAFILDTKHLGTVAVDLHTVGRAVTVSVKTEALRAAERFADSLTRLTDRLTHLRYRVASTDAQVARPANAPSAPVTAPVIPSDPPESNVDSRA